MPRDDSNSSAAIVIPNPAAHNLFRALRVLDVYAVGDDAIWRFEGGIQLRFRYDRREFEASFVVPEGGAFRRVVEAVG